MSQNTIKTRPLLWRGLSAKPGFNKAVHAAAAMSFLAAGMFAVVELTPSKPAEYVRVGAGVKMFPLPRDLGDFISYLARKFSEPTL